MPQGLRIDEHGVTELWCCLCQGNEPEHGTCPGYTDGERAWYPWGGREHMTDNFKISKSGTFSKETRGKAPAAEGNGTKYWYAVCNTEWGRLPGKTNGECAWFCYAGEER